MGDRGNVCIKQEWGKGPKKIFFYTHWMGTSLPRIVQEALARKQRWDDDAYLARIIFCQMLSVQRDSHEHTLKRNPDHADFCKDVLSEEETGFGICTDECDPNHPLITVDIPNQNVTIKNRTWTFSEYIKHKFKEE